MKCARSVEARWWKERDDLVNSLLALVSRSVNTQNQFHWVLNVRSAAVKLSYEGQRKEELFTAAAIIQSANLCPGRNQKIGTDTENGVWLWLSPYIKWILEMY